MGTPWKNVKWPLPSVLSNRPPCQKDDIGAVELTGIQDIIIKKQPKLEESSEINCSVFSHRRVFQYVMTELPVSWKNVNLPFPAGFFGKPPCRKDDLEDELTEIQDIKQNKLEESAEINYVYDVSSNFKMPCEKIGTGDFRTFDEINDAQDSLMFFNYSSDGSSYNPVRSPIFDQSTEMDDNDINNSKETTCDPDEEEHLNALEHLWKETGHNHCQCRRAPLLVCGKYEAYPPLRVNPETVLNSFQLHRNIENNRDKLCNTEDFLDFVESVRIDEELEYMTVASKTEPSLNIILFVDKTNSPFLGVQHHLLLCVLRSFFICPDKAISIKWSNSVHYNTLHLLANQDIKIKFADSCIFAPENLDNIRACLILTHDASVLLRDSSSSLLTNVADILLINRESIVVFDVIDASQLTQNVL